MTSNLILAIACFIKIISMSNHLTLSNCFSGCEASNHENEKFADFNMFMLFHTLCHNQYLSKIEITIVKKAPVGIGSPSVFIRRCMTPVSKANLRLFNTQLGLICQSFVTPLSHRQVNCDASLKPQDKKVSSPLVKLLSTFISTNLISPNRMYVDQSNNNDKTLYSLTVIILVSSRDTGSNASEGGTYRD